MPCPLFHSPLVVAIAALSLLTVSCAVAASPDVAPFDIQAQSSADETTAFIPLPAGADELTFRGEVSSRSFSIYLTAAQAARIRTFQVASLASIVAFPDRSSVTVTINGRRLATVPLGISDKGKVSVIPSPVGLLIAGANIVRIDVALTHRVDCSVQATYELWARMDPASTGFSGAAAAPEIHKIRDVEAEPVGEDGATHVRVRMSGGASPDVIAGNAEFVRFVARGAHLRRPIVDVADTPGEGRGFDLFLSSDGEPPRGEPLQVVGQDNGLTFFRNVETHRLTIVATAADLQERSARSSFPSDKALGALNDDGVLTFDKLGLWTGAFSGRHYLSSAAIELPDDFFSADYDKVRLSLDGAHSDDLEAGSGLAIRVNGELAASLPFRDGRSETFRQHELNLPLSYFKPGRNEVAVESMVASPQDSSCDVANPEREARLIVGPTSELRFPHLAHMATYPRLASALRARFDEAQVVHVYAPNATPDTLGLTFTTLANLGERGAGGVSFHPYAPTPSDPPGLVVSSFDELSSEFALALRRIVLVPSAQDPEAAPPSATGADRISQQLSQMTSLGEYRTSTSVLTLPEKFLLVGAIATPDSQDESWLPRFAKSAPQWIVVADTAADAGLAGLRRFTANGGWARLAGQISVYDFASGELMSAEPAASYYVQPDRLAIMDIRPILGGMVSRNAGLSFGVMGGVIVLLGALTHALIRRMGAR